MTDAPGDPPIPDHLILELHKRIQEVAPKASLDDLGVIVTGLRRGFLLVTNRTTGRYDIYRYQP